MPTPAGAKFSSLITTASARELDARKASARPTILVAVHSFTPEFKAESRPWHVGVLYNRDARLAHILLADFRAESGLVVGDNQPYSVSDETDYAIPDLR